MDIIRDKRSKLYIPMVKKQSIPTIRKIFSIIDGLELASMHLNSKKIMTMRTTIAQKLFIVCRDQQIRQRKIT